MCLATVQKESDNTVICKEKMLFFVTSWVKKQ